MGAKPQVDNVGMGRFDLSYENCTATIRWHLSEIFSKSSANMGQSTSLDFLARISCHHVSLWMHCLLVTKKCDTGWAEEYQLNLWQ